MWVWLSVVAVMYAEWNRCLPHGAILRFFFIGTTAANVVNLSALKGLAEDKGLDSIVYYYGSVKTPIIIVCMQSIVTFFMFIGIFPSIKEKIEPTDFQEKQNMEDKRGTGHLLLSVLVALGNRMGFFWLVMGLSVAATKGYIQQEVNFYDGMLFSHVSADKDYTGSIESLKWLAMLYGTLSLGSGLSAFLCNFAAEKLVHGQNGIRARLFYSLIRQEMNFHNTNTSGELASRFSSDTMRMKILLAETLPDFAENLALVVFGCVFLFTAAWDLTLYMLGVVPLAFGLSYFQAEKLAVYVGEGQEKNSKLTSKVQDVFGKFPTVLIYGKQEHEMYKYKVQVRDAYGIFIQKAIFNGILLAISGTVSWGTQTLAFFLGVDLFRSKAGFAVFLTFTLYALNVVQGLLKILQLLPSLGEALGAAEVVLGILQREPGSPEDEGGSGLNITEGSIAFEQVRFTYPNADSKKGEALKGISFTAKPSTKVAIVGDSGAGKSTILQLIARFYDVSHGRILIDGQDIAKCTTRSLRTQMAMVSQDSDLFAMSLLENILYGLEDEEGAENQELVHSILTNLREGRELPAAHQEIVSDVMKAVALANANDFIKSTSDLTFELGEGGSGLSGGQKQRVTIARALYRDPKILILDEVTSALDQVSESIIQAALDRLTKDRTVLVVAHRLHTIKNADLILVMDGGTILAQGKHDDLMDSCQKYSDMVLAAEKKDSKVKSSKTAEVLKIFQDMAHDISTMDKSGPLGHLYELLLPFSSGEIPASETTTTTRTWSRRATRSGIDSKRNTQGGAVARRIESKRTTRNTTGGSKRNTAQLALKNFVGGKRVETDEEELLL